ncbi:FMN-dependent dehydrogenase [Legionella quinlivanii]|uniref:FMN-dependent dehydrogenase n=1 Tax=Legionella quinlivanii TaxID=45073 RepID=A0A0W0Y0Z9_9GAMM|nr:alpha-hydroxy acid oxidase [Legionella quinlivanii]KTD50474.1 FMN-dependent dehydrogenase [Legionella quinlivanii]SEF39457.1 (S)-2-hydroxy-acid oxidase [Legionella quinlivanii DSM 21216]STY12074.1 FMN-dependent dehydrogenase [Legionella quinlivanii]
MEIINTKDFEKEARHKLTQPIYDFIAGGAGDEYTMNRNVEAFRQIQLVPQIFRSSSHTDTSISLFNHQLSHPFMVAPSAFHSCVHPEGEIATVRAVNQMGIAMVLSTMSSTSLEAVAKEATCPLWFQLYIFKDRSITQQLIQRAVAAGYTALVLTVDVPIMGNRERDQRNRFKWQAPFTSTQAITSAFLTESDVKQTTDALFASDLSWDDIEWLKAQTDLPIILKGIMHEKDAEIAINLDIAALVISNHGGRQLDYMPSTMEVLPPIAKQVAGKIPLLIDGGFRRGIDVFKAIALGADCILLGRSVLWALAVNGTEGLKNLFDLYSKELSETMIFCGCKTINDIKIHGRNSIRLLKGSFF